MKYSVKTTIISAKDKKKSPLRVRISFAGVRVDLRLGLSIPPECWDQDKERAHTKKAEYRQLCTEANMRINDFIKQIDELFARCELIEKRVPTVEEIKSIPTLRINTSRLSDVVEGYINENRHLEKHTISNYQIMQKCIHDVKKGDPYINDFTCNMITTLVNKLSEKYKNSTVRALIVRLKVILKWATKKGLYNGDGLTYEYKFKTIPRVIIYLTREELLKFLEYKPETTSERNIHLIYCFCAFTGLRISDAQALTWDNVSEYNIELITTKTTDNIVIELNKYSRQILEKAREIHNPDNKVFPRVHSPHMRTDLHNICRKLGFDTPVSYTYYKGNERITETKPKWEFVSIHTARKTFVINAITLGIPIVVIMKWTGHKTIKNIEPYMKIVDEVKRENMDKFDDL